MLMESLVVPGKPLRARAFAQQTVDQWIYRRWAGPQWRAVGDLQNLLPRLVWVTHEHVCGSIRSMPCLCSADMPRITHAQAGKIRQGCNSFMPSVLLARSRIGLPDLRNTLPPPCSAVRRGADDEEYKVGFCYGVVDLPGRKVFDTICQADQAPGINQYAGDVPNPRDPVLPVPGDTGHVGNQGVARPGQGVEQCGFAYIGPTYNSNNRQHGLCAQNKKLRTIQP
jgi:hypothetical protein